MFIDDTGINLFMYGFFLENERVLFSRKKSSPATPRCYGDKIVIFTIFQLAADVPVDFIFFTLDFSSLLFA